MPETKKRKIIPNFILFYIVPYLIIKTKQKQKEKRNIANSM